MKFVWQIFIFENDCLKTTAERFDVPDKAINRP